MTYSGYIYIWYDTIAKFFYIGSHFGKVEDSYVASSKPMMRAYKKRPETFRFRVLEYCYGNVTDLQHLEQKWLDKIHDNELMLTENIYNNTCRYYNVKKWAAGGNGKGTNKGKKNGGGWNKGKKMSKSVNPGGGWNKGKQGEFYHSAESRKKMSESAKRRWRDNPPIRMKKQYKEKECPACGNKFQTKHQYCSFSCARKRTFTPEYRQKLSDAKKGRIWIHNVDLKQNKLYRGDDVPEGWVKGRRKF